MTQPGLLSDLSLAPLERIAPGPGEVEIEVRAIGLNLREVLKALGLFPDLASAVTFGGDFVGRVVRIGEGVGIFEVGDLIVGHGGDTFRSHITLPAAVIVSKPQNISDEAAATLPIAFLTAYYALYRVARLRAGERILIHAATGGVGLAAVQLAQRRRAIVFATAGSEEKQAFLKSLGVAHVMNSRRLDFVDEIERITSGAGVDVVLNSLAGEFLSASLKVLGKFGRFLEIGKKDIYENSPIGLYAFRNNLTFCAIDLEQAPKEKGGQYLNRIMAMIRQGLLQPLPQTVFPLARYREAFRFMRQARHIGKIVIQIPPEATNP
jgi:NADPH:quinone reductase-like Zn-dependent oxidoreductase